MFFKGIMRNTCYSTQMCLDDENARNDLKLVTAHNVYALSYRRHSTNPKIQYRGWINGFIETDLIHDLMSVMRLYPEICYHFDCGYEVIYSTMPFDYNGKFCLSRLRQDSKELTCEHPCIGRASAIDVHHEYPHIVHIVSRPTSTYFCIATRNFDININVSTILVDCMKLIGAPFAYDKRGKRISPFLHQDGDLI